MVIQVEFCDLILARKKIATINQPMTLINAAGSIKYLGAVAIDQIFKTLTAEFNIKDCIFRVDDDITGLFQAIHLCYRNILYTGTSKAAGNILQQNNQPSMKSNPHHQNH